MKLIDDTQQMLHYNANRQGVAFARVLLFGFWACLTAITPIADLALLPRELAIPTGIVGHLPDSWHAVLWTPGALTALKWILVASSALCALSEKAVRFAGPIACIGAMLFQCLVRSYGNMNHSEIGMLLAICALTAFAWINNDKRIADWQARGFNPFSGPLLTIPFVIATAYTLIGVQRFGLEFRCLLEGNHEQRVFFTHAMATYSVGPSEGEASYKFAKGWGSMMGQYPWVDTMVNVGFVVVTAFELTAWLILISKPYRIAFVIVMTAFHVGSLILMRLFFWEHVILYLFLFDISRWVGPKRVVGRAP